MRDLDRELLNYGHPSGYWRLRKAISSYLAIARSVHCAPEQVIIHAGSQQALYLAAQILLDPGETAWIEDPGYLGARSALIAAGAKLVPVPVDEQGLNVSKGIKRNPNPKLIYVTPSNQYPLTITMTLSRRMELLAHANRSGAWIIEDDYDSEFRYEKHPIAALQGLDKNDRVIYIGTFSKLLVPTLRLGFLVVPPVLVDAFSAAIALISRSSPAVEQAVLADFIEEGHLGRHIRAMRMLYMERQIYFREIARRELDDLIEVRPTNAGTHLIGWLPAGDDDSVASAAAARQGVLTMPLSMYCLKTPARGALILGYASFEKHETAIGIQKLATGLRRQVYG
jgi:GntR family transcriptional regulator/MocR family aminotransferase